MEYYTYNAAEREIRTFEEQTTYQETIKYFAIAYDDNYCVRFLYKLDKFNDATNST